MNNIKIYIKLFIFTKKADFYIWLYNLSLRLYHYSVKSLEEIKEKYYKGEYEKWLKDYTED